MSVDIHIRDINDKVKRSQLVSDIVKDAGPFTFEVGLEGGVMAFKPTKVEYDGMPLGWLRDGSVVSHDTVEMPGWPWVEDYTLLVMVTEYRVTGTYYDTVETKVKHPDAPFVVGIPTSKLVRITPTTKNEGGER